jgi:Predicted integral membrane protein
MDYKSILRTTVKVFVPLTCGLLLLWFLYGKMDLNEIMNVVRKGVRYDIIIFSCIFCLFANTIRAYRWGLLIESLGEKYKTSNVVCAVLGNYALNLVLPRLGEVWRCGVIAKYEKISFTKLLGTLFVDRISDSIMVGFITLFIFIFNIKFFRNFFASNPELLEGFKDMFSSIWVYALIVFIVIFVWFMFARMGDSKLVQKSKGMLQNIWAGIKSIWLMKHKTRFIFQTLLIWAGYFFYFYVTFYAFDFTSDLSIGVGLIAFTMSSIAVAVPVQAGIGPWHFMVIATLVLFGVKETDAAAFALVVHAIHTIWEGLCGLVCVILLPIINKERILPANS